MEDSQAWDLREHEEHGRPTERCIFCNCDLTPLDDLTCTFCEERIAQEVYVDIHLDPNQPFPLWA